MLVMNDDVLTRDESDESEEQKGYISPVSNTSLSNNADENFYRRAEQITISSEDSRPITP